MYDDLFDTERSTAVRMEALRPPAPPRAPGVWEGAGRGAGLSAMKGFAETARNIGVLTTPVIASSLPGLAYEAATGENVEDKLFGFVDQALQPAVRFWEPKPDEVGAAGQVLGALTNMGAKAMLGGAPGLVAQEQMSATLELAEKGASATTAVLGGASRGTTTAIGLALPPALGSGRVSSALIGAVVNPAVGVYDRAVLSGLLASEGLKAADDYKPFDRTQVAIDAAFGLVFGGVFGRAKPKDAKPAPIPDAREAVQTSLLRSEQHTGQLLPKDTFEAERAMQLNVEAEARALAGEPVAVHPDTPLDAASVRAAADRVDEALRRAEREAEPDLPPAPPRPLNDAQARLPEIETALRAADEMAASDTPLREFLDRAIEMSPVVKNLVVGISEARGDMARISRMLDDFGRAAEAQKGRALVDVAADAVEASRSGRTVTAEPGAAKVPPEILKARQAVAERPDMEIPVGVDDAGNVIRQRASDALADAEQTIQRAEVEGRAFDAAVACVLRG